MKDDIKSEINALLDKYEERKVTQKEEYEAQKSEGDTFIGDFYSILENTIKPAMEDVGKLLESRGQNYQIEEQDETVTHDRKTQDAKISIYFLLPDTKYVSKLHQYPSVSFIATKYKKKVWVHENTIGPTGGGHGGPAGEYKLDEITTDLVHKKIMTVLKKIF